MAYPVLHQNVTCGTVVRGMPPLLKWTKENLKLALIIPVKLVTVGWLVCCPVQCWNFWEFVIEVGILFISWLFSVWESLCWENFREYRFGPIWAFVQGIRVLRVLRCRFIFSSLFQLFPHKARDCETTFVIRLNMMRNKSKIVFISSTKVETHETTVIFKVGCC